jgi:hypothetical protein
MIACKSFATTLAGFIACVLLWTSQPAAQETPPRVVSGPEISAMIRSTVVAIHQANTTGNYTVLRDLSALGMYADKSAADLSDFFRPLREAKIDLADTVMLEPLLGEEPKLSNDGVLQLKGWFPREQDNVTFDLTYRFEYGAWRILSISIGVQPIMGKAAPALDQNKAPSGKAPNAKQKNLPKQN